MMIQSWHLKMKTEFTLYGFKIIHNFIGVTLFLWVGRLTLLTHASPVNLSWFPQGACG